MVEDTLRDEQDTLIERLKMRVLASPFVPPKYSWYKHQANPPVTATELAQAEALLGFPLPPLLKSIYLEVGNGGFGPGYGLFRLHNEEDPGALRTDSLITTYLALRSLTPEQFTRYWVNGEDEDKSRPRVLPEKVVMICEWGCNIYSYLDCSTFGCPVLRLDHNTSMRKLTPESPSFSQWLDDWLHEWESGEQ